MAKPKPHRTFVAVTYHGSRTFMDGLGRPLKAGGEGFVPAALMPKLLDRFESGELAVRGGEFEGEAPGFTWATVNHDEPPGTPVEPLETPPSPAPAPPPEAPAAPEAEPVLFPEDPDGPFPDSPVGLKVKDLRRIIPHLPDLDTVEDWMDAEKAGKGRTTVLDLLGERWDEIDYHLGGETTDDEGTPFDSLDDEDPRR